MRLPSTSRGLPPKIDLDTYAAWLMQDGTTVVAQNADTAVNALAQSGALPTPTVVNGLIGKARRFTETQIMVGGAAADDITTAQGSWTWSVWVRALAASQSSGFSVIVGLAGPSNDEASDANTQIAIMLDLTNHPIMFWEHGSGTNVTLTAPDPVTPGEWTLITVRKIVDTTADVDILVNGRVVASDTGLTNADGGGNLSKMNWVMGALLLSSGTAIANGVNADVGPSIFTAAIMSDDEVGEIFRRGASLATPYQTHARVLVEDSAGGTLRDVSEGGFYGFDFVQDVSINDDVDNDTAGAVVTLAREFAEVSLAPLKGDSYLNNPTLASSYTPKIDGWRKIEILEARIPLWLDPPTSSSTDLVSAFLGRIDEIDDADADRITLSCRDEAARAAERYIEDEIIYPQSFGGGGCGGSAQAREIVMQEVIDDNGAYFTLRTVGETLSCMLEMEQPLPRGHLLPTLRSLAQEIGWDVRWKWDPLNEEWALTMFEPLRERLAPHIVISPRVVESTSGGRQQTAGVRNQWTVTYPNSASLDGEGNRLPASVTVSDATSITNFDLRAAEVVEDSSSQIDTSSEATRMASAALADTKDPSRNTGKAMAFDSRMEVGDICILQPSGLDASVNQYATIQNTSHRWSAEDSKSIVRADGQPVAGFSRWLSIEAGRNGRPPIRNPAEALTGRGIGTLLPGILDIVDRSIYLGGQKFLEIKNGDFARFTRGLDYPPDSWTMSGGDWGSGLDAQSSTDSESGGFSVVLLTTTAELTSQAVALIGNINTPYSVEVRWMRSTGDDLVEVELDWLDASRTFISSTTLLPGGLTGFVGVDNFPTAPAGTGTWFSSQADGIAPPSGARFVQVKIRGSQVGGAFGALLVDSVQLFRSARRTKTGWTNDAVSRPLWANFINPLVTGVAVGTIQNITFLDIVSQATILNGDVYDVYRSLQLGTSAATVNGAFYEVKETGKIRIYAKIWWGTGGGIAVGQPVGFEIVKNGTYSTTTGQRTGGTVIVSNRFAKYAGVAGVAANFTILEHESYFQKGDRITVDVRNDAGSGVLQIAFGSPVAGVEDRTYVSFDARVAD